MNRVLAENGQDYQWEQGLANALGYRVEPGSPLTEYVLPVHPFRIIGPFVIITELVLDAQGGTIWDADYTKPKVKHRIRLRPRTVRV